MGKVGGGDGNFFAEGGIESNPTSHCVTFTVIPMMYMYLSKISEYCLYPDMFPYFDRLRILSNVVCKSTSIPHELLTYEVSPCV